MMTNIFFNWLLKGLFYFILITLKEILKMIKSNFEQNRFIECNTSTKSILSDKRSAFTLY